MKKFVTIILSIIITMTGTTTFAAEIPRESTPLNATEEQICIVENLIGDMLDEVQNGKLGYTLDAGYANTRIRKAVIAGETNGHSYGILSPIVQNTIRVMRDRLLRPEIYSHYEEYLKILLADILIDVKNGMDLEDTRKAAYLKIYQSVNPSYTPREIGTDWCYIEVLSIDVAMFTVARKLILESRT